MVKIDEKLSYNDGF